MELVKAEISELNNPSKRVPFQFNPSTISFSKTANYRQEPSQAARKAPHLQFRGTGPTELSLDMVLDDVESGKDNVASSVEQLLAWTEPAPDTKSTSSPNPSLLQFKWGLLRLGTSEKFVGVLKSVNVSYELFKRDGTPTRATVKVNISTPEEDKKGQNPTSGGDVAHRAHTVRAGDSLPSVAFSVYGHAHLWRRIADANHIEHPLVLRPGTVLQLPMITTTEDR